MVWAALIIGGILLAIRYSAFRKLVLIVVLVLTVLIGGYFINQHADEERAKQLVRQDQLNLLDWGLGPNYGSSYTLTGRIKNNSAFSVTSVRVKVTIQDCDEKNQCDVVGQSEESISTLIPPGQVRDVDHSFYFSDMKIRGRYTWSYSVIEIDARS